MALMSRLPLLAVAGAACAALALPAYASAEIIEIGKVDPPRSRAARRARAWPSAAPPATRPRSARTRGVMTIPKDGSLVAWTIGLGKPGKKQTDLLQRQARRRVPGAADGPQPAPQAALARRRPGRRRRSSRPTSAPPCSSRWPSRSRSRRAGSSRSPCRRGRPRWPSASAPTPRGAPAAARARARTPRPTRCRRSPTSSRSTTACTRPRAWPTRPRWSPPRRRRPRPSLAAGGRYGASRSIRQPSPSRAVAQAIVQAPGAALPELDALGAHEEAAPVRRARDLGAGEALLRRPRTARSSSSRDGDDLALRRRPRADAAPRAGAPRSRRRSRPRAGAPTAPSTRTERWISSQPKVSAA